jgi:glycosyltransferase involved in cell wall biosynthesis
MPTVSIVVPSYNHARFLRRRIESILQQTFRDFELILMDDCSADDSWAILSSYASDPRVRLFRNEVNSANVFQQWNKGVSLALGEFVWIAESDDDADPRLLRNLVTALETNPNVTFAYCRSRCISGEDQALGFADAIYFPDLEPERWKNNFCADGYQECRTHLIRYNSVPNASSVLFREAIYREVGGADESFRLCGDWKLWASMALRGDVAYIAEPLNYFRIHNASVTSSVDQARVHVLEWLRVARWILERVECSEVVLKKVYEHQASRWVPMIISLHVPWEVKLAILRAATAVDPNPTRRAIRPALATVERKILRYWRGLKLNVSREKGHDTK